MSDELSVIPAPMFLAPVVSLSDALQAYQLKKNLIDEIFTSGVDFGVIPGASKPTLYKAGAEKAASFFGLRPIFEDRTVIEDWTGQDHAGEAFFYYRRTCNLYRGNVLIASVDGSCNSWEKKYRWRLAERRCPSCEQAAIMKSKFAPKNKSLGTIPGWYCYEKKGGCGAEFAFNDINITEQQLGQVRNPDAADVVNTVLKMADKRALVAAILIATGLSEYFTQDIEDFIDGQASVETVPPPTPDSAAPKPTAKATTNPPTQPRPAGTKTMKANSKDAIDLFAKVTTLGTGEAAKTLLAHFKGNQDVTAEEIEAYARKWAGWEPEPVEAADQDETEKPETTLCDEAYPDDQPKPDADGEEPE